jgi:hypothetical protein
MNKSLWLNPLLCHVGLGGTLLILFMDHGSCVVWVGVKTMNLKV